MYLSLPNITTLLKRLGDVLAFYCYLANVFFSTPNVPLHSLDKGNNGPLPSFSKDVYIVCQSSGHRPQ